jgi:hypothetical protein
VHRKFIHQRQQIPRASGAWPKDGPREYVEALGSDFVRQARREDAGNYEIEI